MQGSIQKISLGGGGGGGSVKYVWEGPTRSMKILQRVHGEM